MSIYIDRYVQLKHTHSASKNISFKCKLKCKNTENLGIFVLNSYLICVSKISDDDDDDDDDICSAHIEQNNICCGHWCHVNSRPTSTFSLIPLSMSTVVHFLLLVVVFYG